MDDVVQKDEWDENEDLRGGFEDGTDTAVLISDESGKRGNSWRRAVKVNQEPRNAGHCPYLS